MRYLTEMGHRVTVYTAEDADYPSYDEALLKLVSEEVTVIRRPIWEPYGVYRKLTGRGKDAQMQSAFNEAEKAPSLAQRAAVFVRSNFFIPDARKFWIKPSGRFLEKWLGDNPVDVMITNGTPHSCHLIGLWLKRKYPELPWLADFRDPWTNIDYFSQLTLVPRALARHQEMERAVMRTADAVTTVSWAWQRDFEEISGRKNVHVVTNGYIPEQYAEPVRPDEGFTVYHTGVMGKDRNYPALWRAFRRLLDEEDGFAHDFRLVLIGEVDGVPLGALHDHGLGNHLERIDFLPHEQTIRRIRGGALLLLLINQADDAPGRLPSKLYEYLGARRPVVALSPLRGDAARILEETGAGKLFLANEEEALLDYLRERYRAWRAGEGEVATAGIERYSRRTLAGKLVELLEGLV